MELSPPVPSGPQPLSFQVFPLQSLWKSFSCPTRSKGEEQKGLNKPKMASDSHAPPHMSALRTIKSFNTDT